MLITTQGTKSAILTETGEIIETIGQRIGLKNFEAAGGIGASTEE